MTNLPDQIQPRKKAASVFLGILALVVAVPLLFGAPRPARAFPVEELTLETLFGKEIVEGTIVDSMVEGVMISAVNLVSYFLNQLAMISAEAIVSGNIGQSEFWETRIWDQIKNDAFYGALGDSLFVLSEEGGFSEMGLNLCDPSANLALQIQLGLLKENQLQGPRCKLEDIGAAYERFYEENLTQESLLKKTKDFLKPGNSPLSVSLSVFRQVNLEIIPNKKEDEWRKSLMTAVAGGGFENVTDPVTGKIKAPAEVTKQMFLDVKKADAEDKQEYSALSNVGAIAKGAWKPILASTAQTFVDALLTKTLNKGISWLVSLGKGGDTAATSYALLNPAGVSKPGARDTRVALQTVFPQPTIREVEQYDIAALMTVCPTIGRQPFNCVMDAQLANAVRVAGATPYTVGRAVKEGLLHGEWPLISSKDPRDKDTYCYTYGYCESNLKKLRAARILPIGWEIAASQSPVGQPVRLKDIIAKFNDCNDQGVADAAHPWCHLIDSDWVLKQPKAQCHALAYGPILASPQTSSRLEMCVDLASCLREDDAGQCVGGYGYCTRERSVWRFNGESCPEYYHTCRALTPRAGSQVSLLMNTIDYGYCSAANVGCQAYSLLPNLVTYTRATPCATEAGCRQTVTESCTVAKDSRSCSTARGETCTLPELKCGVASCTCTLSHSCLVAKGATACVSYDGVSGDASDDWLAAPARYFNKDAAACPAKDAGCTPLVQLGTGQSLNLVRNGGFEEVVDGDGDGTADHAAYWLPAGMVPADDRGLLSTDGTKSVSGSNAIRPTKYTGTRYSSTCILTGGACAQTGGCQCVDARGFSCLAGYGAPTCDVSEYVVQTGLPIRQNQTYTLSAKLKSSQAISGTVFGLMRLDFKDAYDQSAAIVIGDPAVPIVATGGTCGTRPSALEFKSTADTFSCTFVITKAVASASLSLYGDGEVWFDDVMLEEGGGSFFHEAYGDANQLIYAKVAPEFYGCRGEGNDPAECQNYAGVCRENEVGCDLYKPANGDPNVPGIVGPQDYCPAECVGYDVFKQEPSEFEGDAKFPLYFVPSTALACSADDVGCSEFTDVKTEKVAYYSKLRLCQDLDAEDTGVFYTWEGSDTTGYQLKVWNLKTTDGAAGVPESDICGQAAGCADGTGVAPCTKLDSEDNLVEKCVDQPDIDEATGQRIGFCTPDDIAGGNFDCREFYDADGNRHYRLLSRTIIAAADCPTYRITTSIADDCTGTNGKWDSTKLECHYRASPADSQSCAKSFNGCRAYKGNAATNIQSVLTSDFENGAGGWKAAGTQNDATVSSEAVTVGGHSLKLARNGVQQVAVEVGGKVQAGRFYTVNFWARGGELDLPLTVRFKDGTTTYACSLPAGDTCPADSTEGCRCVHETGLACIVPADGNSCDIKPVELPGTTYPDCINQPDSCLSAYFANRLETPPSLKLRNDWRQYSLGPVSVADAKFGTGSTWLLIESGGTNEVFIDNVILKEVQDTISVVRDSWRTPYSCDQTLDGAPSPLEMLGCREYLNLAGQKLSLRSFSQLCREQSVGCAAYSNTQNTPDQPYAQSYNAVCVLDGICTATGGNTNCVCDYKIKNPVLSSQTVIVKADACRVALNEKECRFNLDGRESYAHVTDRPDIVRTPADARAYLVVGKSSTCPASSTGCRAFGAASVAYDGECKIFDDQSGAQVSCNSEAGCNCTDVQTGRDCIIKSGQNSCRYALEGSIAAGWKKVAFKDDPAQYAKTLCLEREVGCEQYSAKDGTFYFKNPGSQTCEFKENAAVESCSDVGGKLVCEQKTRSGWFRQSASGQTFPCYPDLLKQGDYYGIYKNADVSCSLAERCPSDSSGCECVAADGNKCYVAPGNLSCGYTGWVGACLPQYDRCEEFVDTLATSTAYPEGQPYYYLINGRLDLSSCAGGVNLKQGCVLLKRSSDTSRPYSAAATYAKGIREGANMTIPVSAVDCGRSENKNYCSQRCFAYQDGRCAAKSEIICRQDADCAAGDKCEGVERYGYACGADADCDVAGGEKCVTPLVVGQSCPADKLCHVDSKNLNQLANDANVVMKVRQDRECSEWLQCRQYETVWDGDAGKWKSICTDFGLCQEMRKVGQSYECVRYGEPEKRLLSRDNYSTRNISWRGADYTGYSLPFRYPTQSLQPISLGKGYCQKLAGGEVSPPQACRYADECQAIDPVNCPNASSCYCGSALGGVCRYTANNGEKDGLPCNPNVPADVTKHCGAQGYCASSPLAKQALGVNLTLCFGGANDGLPCAPDDVQTQTSADCPGTIEATGAPAVCRAYCGSDAECPSDERYNSLVWPDSEVAQRRGGTCYQHRCFYSFAGGKLIESDGLNRLSCRAYPQIDAPYGPSVLENNGSDSDYDEVTGQPVSRSAAFLGANVCTKANDCDCSYTKVTYGKGEESRYFTGWGQIIGEIDSVCISGDEDGKSCGLNGAVTVLTCRDAGGQCVKKSERVLAAGWPGFCLDRDLATTINRTSTEFACTLWLPVEQMSGMPDRFNQYREAGFQTTQPELLYCQDRESNQPNATNFVDTSNVQSSDPKVKDICSCPIQRDAATGQCTAKTRVCTQPYFPDPEGCTNLGDTSINVASCSLSGQPCNGDGQPKLDEPCNGRSYSRVVLDMQTPIPGDVEVTGGLCKCEYPARTCAADGECAGNVSGSKCVAGLCGCQANADCAGLGAGAYCLNQQCVVSGVVPGCLRQPCGADEEDVCENGTKETANYCDDRGQSVEPRVPCEGANVGQVCPDYTASYLPGELKEGTILQRTVQNFGIRMDQVAGFKVEYFEMFAGWDYMVYGYGYILPQEYNMSLTASSQVINFYTWTLGRFAHVHCDWKGSCDTENLADGRTFTAGPWYPFPDPHNDSMQLDWNRNGTSRERMFGTYPAAHEGEAAYRCSSDADCAAPSKCYDMYCAKTCDNNGVCTADCPAGRECACQTVQPVNGSATKLCVQNKRSNSEKTGEIFSYGNSPSVQLAWRARFDPYGDAHLLKDVSVAEAAPRKLMGFFNLDATRVTVLFKDRCTDVARVYSSAQTNQTDVAWTDRLNQQRAELASKGGAATKYAYAPAIDRKARILSSDTDVILGVKNYWLFHKDDTYDATPACGETDLAPYGRICTPVEETGDGALNFDKAGLDGSERVYNAAVNSFLPVYDPDGHFGPPQTHVAQTINYTWKTISDDIVSDPEKAKKEAIRRDFLLDLGYTYGGYGYYGAADLGQLFAASEKSYGFDLASRTYALDGAAPRYDVREQYVTEANQPQVRAVLTRNCKAEGQCIEGPVGLTVNNVIDESDVVSEIGAGQLKVTLKFYAWADKDHMPIRRKVIDFGDGAAPLDLTGYYKNHRGTNPATGDSWCDGSAWGQTGESCEARYFEETKTYVCNRDLLSRLPECFEPNQGGEIYPCRASRGSVNGQPAAACVFRPRVQITDNWGVCNGVCPGAAGSGNVCMNRTLFADPAWNDDPTKRDECVSPFGPAGQPGTPDAWNLSHVQVKPWAWFAKRIFVYPLD